MRHRDRHVNHVLQGHTPALMVPACACYASMVLSLSQDQQAATVADRDRFQQRMDQKAASTVAQAIMLAIWAQPFAPHAA